MARLIFLLALAAWSASAADFGPYPVKVIRVIDGDTVLVEALVETGIMPPAKFDVRVRLAGVNTPEPRGKDLSDCEREAAAAASAFTREWLARGGALELTITGRDKFGERLDGRIRRGDEDLAGALIEAGHGRPYKGERREAWC